MKHLISLKLVLVLLVTSLSSWAPIVEAAAKTSTCENGECIQGLVDKLEDLGKVYRKQCLPKGIKDSQIEAYHMEHGLTEQCWKYITEISHMEDELQKHQARLEARLGCESGNCKYGDDTINAQLSEFSKVEQQFSCTEPKKQAIRNQCPADMQCVLAATALGVGGYLAELIVPEKAKPKGCHLGNDSCLTQMATAFLKAAITFFEGAWDLLKIIGKKAGQKMKQFWNWVSGAENHSSTSQLAMAKASEDKGVFDMLLNDFPGTMKKIWSAFVGSLKEWMKADVFCQKWSGAPHFSQCLQPTNSFDCIPCKTMVTGLCSVTGTIVAEIVPNFLTGGLVSAAKYGAQGAVKIARMFKVSAKGAKAIKGSRVGKMAVEASTKVDDVMKVTKGLRAAKAVLDGALKAIRTYMLSPGRKILKKSLTVMSNAVKKGGAAIAETPTGKLLIFSGKSAKTALKIVLYPIDNPMTTFAYKSGARSFDKLVNLAAPKLATKTVVTGQIIQQEARLETVLAKLEKAKMAKKPNASEILKLEEQLLAKVEPHRREIVKAALLKGDADLHDIIKHLYPELQYDELAKKLPKDQVLKAEQDLYLEIQRMPAGAAKETMLKRYQSYVAQGEKRASVLGDSKSPFDAEIKVPAEKSVAQANFNKVLTEEQLIIKGTMNTYIDDAQKALLEKAAQTEKMLKASKQPKVYDVIAMGGGPNNAVAVSVLKETNPNLNVLVIESTESLGTFNKIKGFDINTPEFIGDSGNTLPGSPTQLRDYNINDASFASAEDLGNLTVSAYKSADADMIFNNAVVKWDKEPTPGAWPAKYRVETSEGVVVYTNAGIAGTGFGPPITRLKDPASIELVTKYEKELAATNLAVDKKYVPKATSVDDFLTIATKDFKAGAGAVSRYRGKKVLVIGSGDGGNIAVEATAGLNKSLNPDNLDTGIETIWLGSETPTGASFLESLSTRKKLRYYRIAEGLDNGKIKSVNGYLSRVEEFVNEAGEKQFKAYYTTKSGEVIGEPIIVDNLVFATGYPNNHSTLTPVFAGIAEQANTTKDKILFETVNGRVDDFTKYDEFKVESEITKQLTINGQKEDVYAVGVFAKTNITDDEWKVPTGGFLDITAPKSAATGQLIAQKLTPQKVTVTQMQKLLTPAPGQKIDVIKRPLRPLTATPALPNTHVADLHTKIELGKTLRSFKAKPNSTVKISITKGSKGTYVYKVSDLDKRAAEEVAKALSNNAELTRGIDGQFNLGRTMIDVELTTRSTGTFNLEAMKFNPLPITIAKEINPGMNITTGINKFVSPGVKSINKTEDEMNDREEQERLIKMNQQE